MGALTRLRKRQTPEERADGELEAELAELEAKLPDAQRELAEAEAEGAAATAALNEVEATDADAYYGNADPHELDRLRAEAEQRKVAADRRIDTARRRVEQGERRCESLRDDIRAAERGSYQNALDMLIELRASKLAELDGIERGIDHFNRQLHEYTWPAPTRTDIDHHVRMALDSGVPVAMQRIDNPRLRRAVEAAIAAHDPAREAEFKSATVRADALSVEAPNGRPAYVLWRPGERL